MPYCKNCGNQMADAAVVCVKCGFAKGDGASFCQICGRPLAPGTPVCLSCGAGASAKPAVPEGYERRSKLAAGLLQQISACITFISDAPAGLRLSLCCPSPGLRYAPLFFSSPFSQ